MQITFGSNESTIVQPIDCIYLTPRRPTLGDTGGRRRRRRLPSPLLPHPFPPAVVGGPVGRGPGGDNGGGDIFLVRRRWFTRLAAARGAVMARRRGAVESRRERRSARMEGRGLPRRRSPCCYGQNSKPVRGPSGSLRV